MKQSVFIGAIFGLIVATFLGFFGMLKASSNQWDGNERAFREACMSVGGKAVWNNKYWECLK